MRIVRPHHPFEGQDLVVVSVMHRHNNLELCLVLPDGSKSLIPAAWTDLERIPERQGESGTLGSLSDLLHARAVVDRLVHHLDDTARQDRHGADEEVARAVEPGAVRGRGDGRSPWEELAPAERFAVVSTLARLMAKSIEEKEGRHDRATTE